MDFVFFPAKGDILTIGEDVELELSAGFMENFIFFNEILEIAPKELLSLNSTFRTAGGFKTRFVFPAGLEIKITEMRLRTNSRNLDKIEFRVVSWPGRPELSSRRQKLMFVLNPNSISGIKCSSIKKYDLNAMYVRSMTADIDAMTYGNVTLQSQQELINLCEAHVNNGQITRDQADALICKIQSFDAAKVARVKEQRRKRDMFTRLNKLCRHLVQYVALNRNADQDPVLEPQDLEVLEILMTHWRPSLLDAMENLKNDRTAEEYRACLAKARCLELKYLDIPEELKS